MWDTLNRRWSWAGGGNEGCAPRPESTRDLLRRFQLLAWSTMFSPLAQLRVKGPTSTFCSDCRVAESWETLSDTQTLFRRKRGGEEKSLLKSFGFGDGQTGPESLQIPVPTHDKHDCNDVLEGKSFELLNMRRVDRHVRSVHWKCWCSLALLNPTLPFKHYKLTTSYILIYVIY